MLRWLFLFPSNLVPYDARLVQSESLFLVLWRTGGIPIAVAISDLAVRSMNHRHGFPITLYPGGCSDRLSLGIMNRTDATIAGSFSVCEKPGLHRCW